MSGRRVFVLRLWWTLLVSMTCSRPQSSADRHTTESPDTATSSWSDLVNPTGSTDGQQWSAEALFNNSKWTLEQMLHYHGLGEPPTIKAKNAPIPEYLQNAFNALNSQEYEVWQRNNYKGLSSKPNDPTIWGIKTLRVSKERRDLSIEFQIQMEVLRVHISRAELVYPLGVTSYIWPRHMPRVRHSSLKLCLQSVPDQCTSQRHTRPDIVHIQGKFYLIHNITTVFQKWLRSIPKQVESFSMVVIMPRSQARASVWEDATLSQSNGPLLVLYSNVPELVVWQHSIPSANIHRFPIQNQHTRLKRSLDSNGKIKQKEDKFQTHQSSETDSSTNSTIYTRLRRSVDSSDVRPHHYETHIENYTLSDISPYYMDGLTNQGNIESASNNADPYFCSLVKWYVDFSVVGWDSFILHPKGFWGNQCRGPCHAPLIGSPSNENITNHAFIKTLYHLEMSYAQHAETGRAQDTSQLPQTYCAPLLIEPISVLAYSGDFTYVTRIMNDMTVTKCGCL